MTKVSHDLTRTQRNNLKKLADYLESLAEDYRHFDMRDFFDKDDTLHPDQIAAYAKKNGGLEQFHCGTVACAIGHGPSAGILFKRNEFFEEGTPNWSSYSDRFVAGSGQLFHFLFGSDWEDVDNHHWGAAARIRFVLAGRELPEIFYEDDFGDCERLDFRDMDDNSSVPYEARDRLVASYAELRKVPA